MTEEIIQQADEALAGVEESPHSLEEYLELAQENPSFASHSVKYILEAIEHYGTRTVVEQGEEMERYRFFDDPNGDGEHAILGNTEVLNDFVQELRRMASENGENERLIWFKGPTATGKSELKRCLINGLKGYAKTEAGKRYTVEWTLDSLNSGRSGMSYGDVNPTDATWYRSPINANPLSVLPEEVRETYLEQLSDGEKYPVEAEIDIDPFSNEAFQFLKDKYEDSDEQFSKIASSDHLRVVRYVPEVGDGIGVLHSEDQGNVKEKLVGGWMQGAMEEFPSRGRKNAQAFSYEGVLAQGNGTLSIIEDAGTHVDVLHRLLNVSEEGMVKLDNKIAMDIDTLLVLISNPDLEGEITEYDQAGGYDPWRAIRRRMDKYQFRYLTSVSSEVQLLRRMLADETEIWEETGDEALERAAEPAEVYGCEFVPHTLEAVAFFEVLSRCSHPPDDELGRVDKVLALERGYHQDGNKRRQLDDIKLDTEHNGNEGVPVTYTVDVLVDIAQENDLAMPHETVEALCDNMEDAPIFSDGEVDRIPDYQYETKPYIRGVQEDDVLEAMIGDELPDEEKVTEYVDGLFSWRDEEEDEYDPYKLKEFEKRYLAPEEADYNDDAEPSEGLDQWRKKVIIDPINNYVYENRDENFEVSELPYKKSDVIRRLIEDHTWSDVIREYPDFDEDLWEMSPEGTETEELKEKTIERMVDLFGYSEKSAERTSTEVIRDALIPTGDSDE